MAEHRRGANLPSLGGFNRTVVLDAVRRSRDGLSRVELAARTGLSPQTVSNVTRFLIDAGMIVESGTVVAGRGKPRTILRLEARSRFADRGPRRPRGRHVRAARPGGRGRRRGDHLHPERRGPGPGRPDDGRRGRRAGPPLRGRAGQRARRRHRVAGADRRGRRHRARPAVPASVAGRRAPRRPGRRDRLPGAPREGRHRGGRRRDVPRTGCGGPGLRVRVLRHRVRRRTRHRPRTRPRLGRQRR